MNTRKIVFAATLASSLTLAACVPGAGYGPGYGSYDGDRSVHYAPPRHEAHDRAIREAEERHNERVHQLQHEFDKHQISERQLRDGIRQADRELDGQIASLR